MRRLAIACVVIAIAIAVDAGCGGGGGGDLACGTTSCPTATDGCCVLPDPGNDVCFAADGGGCGGHVLFCDGSEDCPGDTVCCYEFGNAACLEAPACNAQGGQPMCHADDTSACLAGEACCPLAGADVAYAVCTTGC